MGLLKPVGGCVGWGWYGRGVRGAWEQDLGGELNGALCALCVQVPGSEHVIEADLVLLAMGFVGPEATLADALNVSRDERTNFK